jgi:hypothetical protein
VDYQAVSKYFCLTKWKLQMKIIMSFWSEPYIRGYFNEFLQDKTWKLSWLLSVASITKIYDKPILYTDDLGKNFL